MAINSAERRRSAIGVSFHYYNPGVSPTSAKDGPWRQQSGHSYSGITSESLTPVGRPIQMVGYYEGQRPIPQNYRISSGEDITFQVTMLDADAVTVNIVGGSGRFAMARSAYAAVAVDSDLGSAVITTSLDAVNGRVDIGLQDTVTDDLVGDYYYEFKWTDALGNELLVAHGYITVSANII